MKNNSLTNPEIGHRVARRKRPNHGIGTIIDIHDDKMCYIKWDKKCATGQQHTTIKSKSLKLVK